MGGACSRTQPVATTADADADHKRAFDAHGVVPDANGNGNGGKEAKKGAPQPPRPLTLAVPVARIGGTNWRGTGNGNASTGDDALDERRHSQQIDRMLTDAHALDQQVHKVVCVGLHPHAGVSALSRKVIAALRNSSASARSGSVGGGGGPRRANSIDSGGGGGGGLVSPVATYHSMAVNGSPVAHHSVAATTIAEEVDEPLLPLRERRARLAAVLDTACRTWWPARDGVDDVDVVHVSAATVGTVSRLINECVFGFEGDATAAPAAANATTATVKVRRPGVEQDDLRVDGNTLRLIRVRQGEVDRPRWMPFCTAEDTTAIILVAALDTYVQPAPPLQLNATFTSTAAGSAAAAAGAGAVTLLSPGTAGASAGVSGGGGPPPRSLSLRPDPDATFPPLPVAPPSPQRAKVAAANSSSGGVDGALPGAVASGGTGVAGASSAATGDTLHPSRSATPAGSAAAAAAAAAATPALLDYTPNMLRRAMDVFGSLVNDKLLRDMPLLLFLTKADLFAQQLLTNPVPFTSYFPEAKHTPIPPLPPPPTHAALAHALTNAGLVGSTTDDGGMMTSPASPAPHPLLASLDSPRALGAGAAAAAAGASGLMSVASEASSAGGGGGGGLGPTHHSAVSWSADAAAASAAAAAAASASGGDSKTAAAAAAMSPYDNPAYRQAIEYLLRAFDARDHASPNFDADDPTGDGLGGDGGDTGDGGDGPSQSGSEPLSPAVARDGTRATRDHTGTVAARGAGGRDGGGGSLAAVFGSGGTGAAGGGGGRKRSRRLDIYTTSHTDASLPYILWDRIRAIVVRRSLVETTGVTSPTAAGATGSSGGGASSGGGGSNTHVRVKGPDADMAQPHQPRAQRRAQRAAAGNKHAAGAAAGAGAGKPKPAAGEKHAAAKGAAAASGGAAAGQSKGGCVIA